MLSITTEQLSAAGSFIAREWGDYGYRIEAIESPTRAVSLFRVVASDGSRFTVVADKWGNCDHVQPGSDARPLIEGMHAAATAA